MPKRAKWFFRRRENDPCPADSDNDNNNGSLLSNLLWSLIYLMASYPMREKKIESILIVSILIQSVRLSIAEFETKIVHWICLIALLKSNC